MNSTNDLDAKMVEIRLAAEEVGAFVADVAISLEGCSAPVAGLDASVMIALIRHVRPRIVYCAGVPFDAAKYVLDGLFGEDADEMLLVRPRVKKLVDRWAIRNGQTAQISVFVMDGGVLHGFALDALWLTDFEAELEEQSEKSERITIERVRAAENEAKKRLGPMVKALMADPRFSGPKVGNAKRMTLAESLFPSEERSTLSAIVDMAEAQYWLASGR